MPSLTIILAWLTIIFLILTIIVSGEATFSSVGYYLDEFDYYPCMVDYYLHHFDYYRIGRGNFFFRWLLSCRV
ncbi:hypothetical protein [Ureibacillus sp. FSL W8-0352]|uniref:hypothetical protein n=1 Tax=Ureibacillus sp. FSL W8-0352 TaxID=2954596 RepID=UPI0030F8B8C9